MIHDIGYQGLKMKIFLVYHFFDSGLSKPWERLQVQYFLKQYEIIKTRVYMPTYELISSSDNYVACFSQQCIEARARNDY